MQRNALIRHSGLQLVADKLGVCFLLIVVVFPGAFSIPELSGGSENMQLAFSCTFDQDDCGFDVEAGLYRHLGIVESLDVAGYVFTDFTSISN